MCPCDWTDVCSSDLLQAMHQVAIETPTPISAMVYKDGISNGMDKAFRIVLEGPLQFENLKAMQLGGHQNPLPLALAK